MELTILGASPACQNPGGACSGYLLQQDDTTLLIDCGSGVFGKLQEFVAPESVQAVIVTHMHADHTFDLMQYRYYLHFGAEHIPMARPHLYLPPTGHDRLLTISRFQDHSPSFYRDVFDIDEYNPEATLQVGPLTIGFVPVQHIPHTYAVRVQHGDTTFAYSADSGPCEGLTVVAQESDLFLCECANVEHSDYPFHLTPRQAGAVARDAQTQRLLLTHRWWVYGLDSAVTEAGEIYEGPIEVAREGMQVTI